MARPWRLHGIEELTLELPGKLSVEAAGKLVRGFEPIAIDGAVTVELLLFSMRGLTLRGLSSFGVSYREALWRVPVRLDGAPAWFGVWWDLDHLSMLLGTRWWFRAPSRRARLDFEDGGASCRFALEVGGAALTLEASPTGEEPEARPARRVVYQPDGSPFEIPWAEVAAPFRRTAEVKVLDDSLSAGTLGPVAWAARGVLHRGREHRCGIGAPLK